MKLYNFLLYLKDDARIVLHVASLKGGKTLDVEETESVDMVKSIFPCLYKVKLVEAIDNVFHITVDFSG